MVDHCSRQSEESQHISIAGLDVYVVLSTTFFLCTYLEYRMFLIRFLFFNEVAVITCHCFTFLRVCLGRPGALSLKESLRPIFADDVFHKSRIDIIRDCVKNDDV